MPLFIVNAKDAAGTEDLRIETRAAHLAYIDTFKDKITVGGPILDSAGVVVGSILVLDVGDDREASALVDADPYLAVRVWESVEIHVLVPVIGSWASKDEGRR